MFLFENHTNEAEYSQYHGKFPLINTLGLKRTWLQNHENQKYYHTYNFDMGDINRHIFFLELHKCKKGTRKNCT